MAIPITEMRVCGRRGQEKMRMRASESVSVFEVLERVEECEAR